MTRTAESGSPKQRARSSLTMYGCCADVHTVRPPDSKDAMAVYGSIAYAYAIGYRYEPSATKAAAEKASGRSPHAWTDREQTFGWVRSMFSSKPRCGRCSPACSWSTGAPGAIAATASTTSGSGSYETEMSARASAAVTGSSATTPATGSPAYRTLSTAISGWSATACPYTR